MDYQFFVEEYINGSFYGIISDCMSPPSDKNLTRCRFNISENMGKYE